LVNVHFHYRTFFCYF